MIGFEDNRRGYLMLPIVIRYCSLCSKIKCLFKGTLQIHHKVSGYIQKFKGYFSQFSQETFIHGYYTQGKVRPPVHFWFWNATWSVCIFCTLPRDIVQNILLLYGQCISQSSYRPPCSRWALTSLENGFRASNRLPRPQRWFSCVTTSHRSKRISLFYCSIFIASSDDLDITWSEIKQWAADHAPKSFPESPLEVYVHVPLGWNSTLQFMMNAVSAWHPDKPLRKH